MKVRKTPIRMCVACRTSSDKRTLMRIVRCPSGDIAADPTGKLAGRGAYICASTECLHRAVKEKRLSRALKAEVPEEAVRQLEQNIKQGSEDM